MEGGIFTSLLHSTISFLKSSYSKREKKFIPVSLSLWYLSNTDDKIVSPLSFIFLWLVDLNTGNLFIVAIMRQVSKNTVWPRAGLINHHYISLMAMKIDTVVLIFNISQNIMIHYLINDMTGILSKKLQCNIYN